MANNSLMDFKYINFSSDMLFEYDGDIENLRKPWVRNAHFVPTVTIYSVAFLVGLIGNALVIFAVFGDRKSRSVTKNFMVSLAVADILFLLVCVPYQTVGYTINNWSLGSVICKLVGFVEMLTAMASILNLSSVSVERFIVIVLPMKSRRWCTVGNTKKILIAVWVVAVALSSPTFKLMDTEHTLFHKNGTIVPISMCACVTELESSKLTFSVYKLIIMFALPTQIMIICYSAVIYSLWISSKQLTQLVPSQRSTNQSIERIAMRQTYHGVNSVVRKCNVLHKSNNDILRARKQVIKILAAVVVVFLIAWGPKLIIQVMQDMKLDIIYTQAAFSTQVVFNCLPYIQSCLNPIIYGFMSKNFRRSMSLACRRYCILCRLFRCFRHKKKNNFNDLENDSKYSNGLTVQTRIVCKTNGSSDEDKCDSTYIA
ncbi:allatostatin-A receptor-like [Mytilus trossulus]|uniref:allatostatin-A receptor-like n=1 Tax=Mytilus trossulus TaxID=6551 RepID=UPI00300638D7